MTFINPPPKFKENKVHYIKHFAERAEKNSFKTFWKDGDLVGLYWRKNAEIDIMAVAAKQQRKGYGTIILTRAIEMVLENTINNYAYLYAVDWNIKGQSFYRKYGMEQNGHSYRLHIHHLEIY
jgi:GNAT superfamily N-acetyltransferase